MTIDADPGSTTGQPDPDQAAIRIRSVVDAVIQAASVTTPRSSKGSRQVP